MPSFYRNTPLGQMLEEAYGILVNAGPPAMIRSFHSFDPGYEAYNAMPGQYVEITNVVGGGQLSKYYYYRPLNGDGMYLTVTDHGTEINVTRTF